MGLLQIAELFIDEKNLSSEEDCSLSSPGWLSQEDLSKQASQAQDLEKLAQLCIMRKRYEIAWIVSHVSIASVKAFCWNQGEGAGRWAHLADHGVCLAETEWDLLWLSQFSIRAQQYCAVTYRARQYWAVTYRAQQYCAVTYRAQQYWAVTYRAQHYCAVTYRAQQYWAVTYRAQQYCAVTYRAQHYYAVMYRAQQYCAVTYRAQHYCAVTYRAQHYCAVTYRAQQYCAVTYRAQHYYAVMYRAQQSWAVTYRAQQYWAVTYRAQQYCAVTYRAQQYCAVMYRAQQYCAVTYRAQQYCAVTYRAQHYCAVTYRAQHYYAVMYRAQQYCAVMYRAQQYCAVTPHLALEYSGKATKIHQRAFGNDHPITARSLELLATVYAEIGKTEYSDSLGHCVSALSKRFSATESCSSTLNSSTHHHKDRHTEVWLRKDPHPPPDTPEPQVNSKFPTSILKRTSVGGTEPDSTYRRKPERRVRFREPEIVVHAYDSSQSRPHLAVLTCLFLLLSALGVALYCTDRRRPHRACEDLQAALAVYLLQLKQILWGCWIWLTMQ
ncbi:hypothetical protein P4O66_001684 [Electrophorus voltai]|uniref:Consortin C-terminal domain-containing protein n=1 Tax=Electrophorus voltai TaxID=2609070 RepID=A0AAD8Z5Q4_9TELE|nr:hypothetical protein P4O66_001684 [Electrophorus voltai]